MASSPRPVRLATLTVLVAAGCAGGGVTAPPKLTLVQTHRVGGAHHRTIVRDGVWYQTFGSSLIGLDPSTAEVLWTVALTGEPGPGPAGPAVDMAFAGRRLFVVVEDTAVVELDTSDPRRPVVRKRVMTRELGIAPRGLSIAGGELFVSGRGGVVRWRDGRLVFSHQVECGRVALAAVGLVVCAGRRVYRLDDGTYLGSASDLQPLPDSFGIGRGLLFVRQGPDSAQVGLMTGSIREVDVQTATVSIKGTVHAARILGDRIWVVTDAGLTCLAVSGDRLLDRRHYELAGARDVDEIDADRLAVAGIFGRAVVRLEGGQPEGSHTLTHTHLEPAGLTQALWDGRYVLAGGPGGTWLYEAYRDAVPATDSPGDRPAADTVAAIHGAAAIDADGRSVTIRNAHGDRTHTEPRDIRILTLAVVGGDLWMGHERGITVVGFGGSEKGRLWLQEPVRYVFPLLDGSGAVWAGDGGFGVVGIAERR